MQAYYEDDAVTIYHGDCRDILPSLPSVDLVLTDPPYGIGYVSAWRTRPFQKEPIVGDDGEFPVWIFDEVKPTSAMMVWARWDILSSLPKPKSYIVWDKGNHSMGDLEHEYGRQWEGLAFYPGPNHTFNKRPADVVRHMRIPPNDLLHPAEKPVGLLRQILSHNEGDVLLDPFCGSGSTLRAAKDLGRKAIGIEIEERYCEIAAKRMEQMVMAL